MSKEEDVSTMAKTSICHGKSAILNHDAPVTDLLRCCSQVLHDHLDLIARLISVDRR